MTMDGALNGRLTEKDAWPDREVTKADLTEDVAEEAGADAAVGGRVAELGGNGGMPDSVAKVLTAGRVARPEVKPGAWVLAAMEDARENPPRAFISTVALGAIEKAPAKRLTPVLGRLAAYRLAWSPAYEFCRHSRPGEVCSE